MKKSSVEEIRDRFDNDVERFSNLETGQSATVDAPVALNLIAEAAAAATPKAKRLLDVGCGAGNFSLRLLESCPKLSEVCLIDLSQPMLDRAEERIATAHGERVRVKSHQSDIRELELEDGSFDVIVAAAVLHHLRTDEEWEDVFRKFERALAPGGSIWIFDLVKQQSDAIHKVLWKRYSDYLCALRDEEYRDHVFAYIEKEDSPRPLYEQARRLESVGFSTVEILHCNSCFAAFGSVKD